MKFITFGSRTNSQKLGHPQLAKSFIPDWYKRAESSFIDHRNGQESDSGLKRCIPYLDVMMSGYMLVTPFDIYVSKLEDGSVSIGWNGPEDMADSFDVRPVEQGRTIPRPEGFEDTLISFSSKWGWKLPRGYSALVCPPFNRTDLPFYPTAGIIDSDKFWANGSIPMFIKKGVTGLIPAGTPIAQLIPIKRDSWKMLTNNALELEFSLQGGEARNKETNYKKKYWVRKDYR